MAKQTRIERQDKAKIESVSIDRFAADAFQLYVQGVDGEVWGGLQVWMMMVCDTSRPCAMDNDLSCVEGETLVRMFGTMDRSPPRHPSPGLSHPSLRFRPPPCVPPLPFPPSTRHHAAPLTHPTPGALTFNIKRGGILYGTVEEGGKVKVDFIYEPPQQGNATNLEMQR